MNYSVTYLPPLVGNYDWSRIKTPELYGFTAQVVCVFSIRDEEGAG